MTVLPFARARVMGIVAVLAVSACSLLQRPGSSAPPSDGNIAAMFLAASNTDVSYAQVALAPGRTSNTDVIAFANRMLNDHGGMNKSALELFSSTGIVPRDNATSLGFRDESAAKRDTLRQHSGVSFDSTYMATEVGFHTRLLVMLDSLLIPSARNTELRAMLSRVRPAVAAHLEHATRVQAGLGQP